MSQQTEYKIFYSYAHADKDVFFLMFKDGLTRRAREQATTLIGLQDDQFDPTNGSEAELEAQMRAADAVIVFLSPTTVTSPQVEREVTVAARLQKLVIPIISAADVTLPAWFSALKTQGIRLHQYIESSRLDEFYDLVLGILAEPPQPGTSRQDKHNLFVASISEHAGCTTVVSLLNKIIYDPFSFPAYFKPFTRTGSKYRDVELVRSYFELAADLTVAQLAPFSYGISAPKVTKAELSAAFDKINALDRPVIIEGGLFGSKDLPFASMLKDVFDARLLIVIDHSVLTTIREPITDILARVRNELGGDIPVGFVLNKVPREGVDAFAQEIVAEADALKLENIGTISFDPRLSGTLIREFADQLGGQIYTQNDEPEDPADKEHYIWRYGSTEFPEQRMLEFYRRLQTEGRNQGTVLFNAVEETANIPLAGMGYSLFLTGESETPELDPTLLDVAEKNGSTVVYFNKPTHIVIGELVKQLQVGTPFSFENLAFMDDAALLKNLDLGKMDVLLRRETEKKA